MWAGRPIRGEIQPMTDLTAIVQHLAGPSVLPQLHVEALTSTAGKREAITAGAANVEVSFRLYSLALAANSVCVGIAARLENSHALVKQAVVGAVFTDDEIGRSIVPLVPVYVVDFHAL